MSMLKKKVHNIHIAKQKCTKRFIQVLLMGRSGLSIAGDYIDFELTRSQQV